MKYSELKSKIIANQDVRKHYDNLEPEYQLVCAMIESRREKNLSQQDLAEATGINRSDISKLENGNANPSLGTLKRIAKGLGKKLDIRFVNVD